MPLIYRYTLCLLFFLTGCTIKPTSSPDVEIHFTAATDINKNKKGEPSPVQIFIYHVHNRDNFSAENPLLLVSSSHTRTRNNYTRVSEFILQPGQEKTVTLPLEPRNNTFAFVAAFRDMTNDQWSVIRTIDNSPKTIWEKFFNNYPAKQYVRLEASTLTVSQQGML